MSTHDKRCLAAAVLAAVENLRDDENLDARTFRLALTDGDPLAMADGYLADGLVACRCTPMIGVVNASMIGTPMTPGEHVDWDAPDYFTAEDFADLVGEDVDTYAAHAPHMILWEV